MNKHDLQDLGGGSVAGLLSARAKNAPDNLALIFGDQRFSYGQLDREVTAAAAGLMELGLEVGDASATFMFNRPEFLFAWLGAMRAGLIHVPVNTAYKSDFLHYTLEHSRSKVVITEARLADAMMSLEQLPKELKVIVYVDGVPSRVPNGDVALLSWDELIAKGVDNPTFPAIQPHDTCAISFTSGTTGRSKAILNPHLQFLVMAREAAAAFSLTPLDRAFTCMPMFHGMAQLATCLAAIYAGAAIALSPGFSVSRFWDEIRQSGATQFNALGSMLYMLLSSEPSPSDREHSVDRVFAAPSPPDALYRFESRFGVHLIGGYGLTEIKNVLYNPRDARKVGALGKPTPSSILEIHDEFGDPVPPGVVGEIVYRPRLANIMFKRYLGDAEPTLAGMHDLWWHTGDLGSMDDDGYFYFVDRKKDALRRRGENISSYELEAALCKFPGVQEVAAVAASSDLGEDEVLVVFEVMNGYEVDFAELFRHCVQTMPRFMVPRYYRRVTTLPRTPTGKVRKVALREDGITEDTWDHVSNGLLVPR